MENNANSDKDEGSQRHKRDGDITPQSKIFSCTWELNGTGSYKIRNKVVIDEIMISSDNDAKDGKR